MAKSPINKKSGVPTQANLGTGKVESGKKEKKEKKK